MTAILTAVLRFVLPIAAGYSAGNAAWIAAATFIRIPAAGDHFAIFVAITVWAVTSAIALPSKD